MSGQLTTTVVSVPAAIGAAAAFGLTGALQQRATKQVPKRSALSPQLVGDLLRRRLWLLSIGTTILGLALQMTALATGPLILVQVLLVLDVPFAVVAGAALARRRPDPAFLLAGGASIGGLALFLLLARPHAGTGEPDLVRALPLALALAVILGACLFIAARRQGIWRVVALAVGTGVLFGVTAGLLKIVTGQVSRGLTTPLSHWPLWAVCVVGPLGFLLSQNTFQAGRFVAPALSIITVLDPLVGIGVGVLLLRETLNSTPVRLAGQTVGLLIMAGGIALVTRHAPQAAAAQAASET